MKKDEGKEHISLAEEAKREASVLTAGIDSKSKCGKKDTSLDRAQTALLCEQQEGLTKEPLCLQTKSILLHQHMQSVLKPPRLPTLRLPPQNYILPPSHTNNQKLQEKEEDNPHEQSLISHSQFIPLPPQHPQNKSKKRKIPKPNMNNTLNITPIPTFNTNNPLAPITTTNNPNSTTISSSTNYNPPHTSHHREHSFAKPQAKLPISNSKERKEANKEREKEMHQREGLTITGAQCLSASQNNLMKYDTFSHSKSKSKSKSKLKPLCSNFPAPVKYAKMEPVQVFPQKSKNSPAQVLEAIQARQHSLKTNSIHTFKTVKEKPKPSFAMPPLTCRDSQTRDSTFPRFKTEVSRNSMPQTVQTTQRETCISALGGMYTQQDDADGLHIDEDEKEDNNAPFSTMNYFSEQYFAFAKSKFNSNYNQADSNYEEEVFTLSNNDSENFSFAISANSTNCSSQSVRSKGQILQKQQHQSAHQSTHAKPTKTEKRKHLQIDIPDFLTPRNRPEQTALTFKNKKPTEDKQRKRKTIKEKIEAQLFMKRSETELARRTCTTTTARRTSGITGITGIMGINGINGINGNLQINPFMIKRKQKVFAQHASKPPQQTDKVDQIENTQ